MRACNQIWEIIKQKRDKEEQAGRGKAKKEAKRYQVCNMQPVPGKKFCSACKCEVVDCEKGRDKTHVESGRFCYSHRTLVTKGTKYANAFGQQVYGRSWDEELRLTARLAFLFNCMNPQDVSSFLQFARRLCNIRGGKLTKEDVVWMILAGALKWPHAVEAFWENVFPLLDGKPTAEGICRCAVAAIRACDGKPCSEMHAEISVTGRAAATSGPKWLGEKLQLIHDIDSEQPVEENLPGKRAASRQPEEMPQKKVKISKHAASSQSPMEQTVTLGKKGRSCKLLARPSDALVACQRVIDVVEGADTEWPDSNDAIVIAKFATVVVESVHTALNIKDHVDKGAYSALGVARKIILFVSDSMPDAFDKCQMEDILKWTADEGGHCEPLKSLSGRAAREAFGLQPVMIPCWTCYLGSCHSAALKALQQASEKSLIDSLKSLNETGNSAPGPHSIARVLIGRSALKLTETK